jgi:hypothetical protein
MPVVVRIKPPWMLRQVDELGPHNPDRTKCWGCNSGRVNTPAICMHAYNQMVKMYRDEKLLTDPVVLAIKMYWHFENKIRIPANRIADKLRQPHIEPWLAADILYHCQHEIMEASNTCHEMILTFRNTIRLITQNDLCEEGVDGTPTVSEDGLDKLIKASRQLRAWYKENPHNMVFGNNADYRLTAGEALGFANNTNRNVYAKNLPALLLASAKRKQRPGAAGGGNI